MFEKLWQLLMLYLTLGVAGDDDPPDDEPPDETPPDETPPDDDEIGRASCRERV